MPSIANPFKLTLQPTIWSYHYSMEGILPLNYDSIALNFANAQ
jgi:hypothetical protein